MADGIACPSLHDGMAVVDVLGHGRPRRASPIRRTSDGERRRRWHGWNFEVSARTGDPTPLPDLGASRTKR